MVAMKTPEQIAAEVADRSHIGSYTNSRDIGRDGFRRAIAVTAIQADREQREQRDRISADRAEEAAISVNAVLMSEQDGFITLSEHDKNLLTRAREHMIVIAGDLRKEPLP